MARHRISASEARKRFAELLRAIDADPGTVFEITLNGIVVAELRGREMQLFKPFPRGTLERALARVGVREVPYPEEGSVSQDHDEYLYGRNRRK